MDFNHDLWNLAYLMAFGRSRKLARAVFVLRLPVSQCMVFGVTKGSKEVLDLRLPKIEAGMTTPS